MKEKRVTYFDYLRVFAVISVVVLHVACEHWGTLDARSIQWQTLNFYDSIVRWGVPVFLMISGALFLDRKPGIKPLYSKYIPRMTVAYCIWSAFYTIALPLATRSTDPEAPLSLLRVITGIIRGHFHLWFIPMIIGIYMCLPLLQQITAQQQLKRYFLLLSFLFAFVIPQCITLTHDFIGGPLSSAVSAFSGFLSNMNMQLVLGYSFYFVLGHELHHLELTRGQRRSIYALGFCGFASTVLLDAVIAWRTQTPCQTYYGNFTVNVAFEAIFVFILCKYMSFPHPTLNRFFSLLSQYCFGAYLIHIFFRDGLAVAGLDTLTFAPVISVPVKTALVVLLSFSLSFILNKIPVLNRWMV